MTLQKTWITLRAQPGDKRVLAAILAIALLLFVSPFPASAGPIPSSSAGLPSAGSDSDRFIRATEAAEVAARLSALGCSRADIQAVLARLASEDIHQLASHARQLQTAGGTRTRVIVIVAIVVVVIVALILAEQSSFRHMHLLG